MCLSTCRPVYLPVCLPACLPAGLPAGLPVSLSVSVSVCLLVCLSVCLSACLFLSVCLPARRVRLPDASACHLSVRLLRPQPAGVADLLWACGASMYRCPAMSHPALVDALLSKAALLLPSFRPMQLLDVLWASAR